MKNFLLVDDHVVVRSGIKTLLLQLYDPATVYEAFDGDSALEKLLERKYDLLMLDIQMPNTESLTLMQQIIKKYPEVRVLVFSMGSENVYAKRFLKAGAKGYISKEAPLEEIEKAIAQLLDNKRYISNNLAETFAKESFETKPANPFNRLSPREFEIASMLLSGQTITHIAVSIKIQVSTAGTHKARMFEKLGVTNLLELKELANTYQL